MVRPFGSPLTNTVRLRVELLEGRIVPAVFSVSNLAESGPGSIRQAIIDANNNPGQDTIQITPGLTGSVILTSGPMTIIDAVDISGTGTIYTSLFVMGTNNSGRVFIVNAPTTMSGIACSSSNASGAFPGLGGGIYSTASLTLNDCGFGGDSATNGGAIYQTGATLTLNRCSFSGGGAVQGGAIYANATVNLQYCQFDSVASNISGSAGGGVYLASGSLTIDSCSFAGCGSTQQHLGKGGAVYCNGTFFAQNSTFASNGADQGAAIYLASGGSLWNCTVANNYPGGSAGGGIYCANSSTAILESTIVSNNSATSGPDIFGAVTAKNCAIGKSSGISSYTDQGGNLAFGLNLQLEDGSNGHGGLVPTSSLQYTSPCKDKGSNPGGALYDSRGPGLARTVGAAPDIGAFEIQPPPKVTIQLNDRVSIQRSRVVQINFTFNQFDITTTSGIFAAFQLKRVSDNAVVTLDAPILPTQPNTLTTKSGGMGFSAGPLDGNSLKDGVYVLTISSAQIIDPSGQHLDGNGDGIGGDDYVSPTTQGNPNRIFRLFGDADGDASVGTSDFAIFRQSFNSVNDMFDFDGDGFVSVNDFIQFRNRFNTSI
jgi:hypothetical protein